MTINPNQMNVLQLGDCLEQALVSANSVDANQVSRLLDILPAVFQEDRSPSAPNFLGRFLLGFEQLLLGLETPPTNQLETHQPTQAGVWQQGLEQTIDRLYRYFEPGFALAEEERAPPEFLQWLAGWVALTLREDWEPQAQRNMIARAVSLYRLRGTRRGVKEFLELYTGLGVSIEEYHNAFQVGIHSTIGKDTLLNGGAPFFFHVNVYLPRFEAEAMKSKREISLAIVDLQKPAHTFCRLEIISPTFRVGVHSTVGIDTLLG